jgi:hypothetical protein
MTVNNNSVIQMYTKESGWVSLDDPSVTDEFKQEAHAAMTNNYARLLESVRPLPTPKTALQRAHEIAQAANDREERISAESSANAYKKWIANGRPKTYKDQS